MYRAGNPALTDSTFDKNAYNSINWWENESSNKMTIEGVSEKTAILLIITATAAIATAMTMPESFILYILGFILSIILALVIGFKRSTNPILISTYAVFEGFLLGGFTWQMESITGVSGLGLLAALITFLILAVMITIYRLGLIHWDKNMQIAITSAVFAIMMLYVISLIGFFVGFEVPIIHDSTPLGIAFSFFVVGIATLTLVADFDFIERGVLRGAPKQLEWRAAFGLLVSLAWFYFEIVRLLGKMILRD